MAHTAVLPVLTTESSLTRYLKEARATAHIPSATAPRIQDRFLMINTHEPSRRRTELALRWLSISRDDARARTAAMAPRARQSPPLAPLPNSKSPSLATVDAHNTCHRGARHRPHTHAVPFKSP